MSSKKKPARKIAKAKAKARGVVAKAKKVVAKAKAKAKEVVAKAKTKKVAAKAKTKTKKVAAKAKTKTKKVAAKAKTKTKKVAAKAKTKAKNVVAKTKAKTTKIVAKKPKVAPRRDATGHLDPTYAAQLLAQSRASREDFDDDTAFLKTSRSADSLAEELGEEAVATMNSGEDQGERLQDEEVEEVGGPFVTTSGRQEFAAGTDRSNPRKATREPFPKT